MEREQEDVQYLGFFGIFKESMKIIFSWKRIFTQITLALILPLSFIFFAHIQISQLLFSKILYNLNALNYTQKGSSSERAAFCVFQVVYFAFLLIFSLLSTSAVVYTIASIYTAKDITFKKVISVVPRVWKRLMVTFLWSFAIVMLYNFISGVPLYYLTYYYGLIGIGITIFIAFLILYLVGFVCISIVWYLASVISVLEDVYGIKAMKKSKALMKGKMGAAVAIILLLVTFVLGIHILFENLELMNVGISITVGILCFFLLCMVFLFGLVFQTVLYFVCKAYHHENIDKSALADHLEVYRGDYVPLKANNVQLGEVHV